MRDAAPHAIRSHDHYLGVLGAGCGEWLVEGADACEEKLLKAAKFASWHLQEHDKIVAQILYR